MPVEPIGFVDAVTKVYSQHATKAPCSSTYPLTVHVGEGWVKLTPALKKQPPPLETPEHLMMQPLDPFSSGGLYSQQELDDWRQLLSIPAYKAALLSSLSYGSCVQQGSCEAEGTNRLVPYDIKFNKLVDDLPKSLDLWTAFHQAIHEWGDGAVVLCLL